MKTVEELRAMSVEDLEAYCKENKVSLVIEDGTITNVCPN
jgi:ribosomal protein L29